MKNQIGNILLEKARGWGATGVRIEQGGKHPRLIGSFDGKGFIYGFPSTPSDWRSWRNCLSDLRRKLGVVHGDRESQRAARAKAPRKSAIAHIPKIVPGPLYDPGDDLFLTPLARLHAAMREQAMVPGPQSCGQGR